MCLRSGPLSFSGVDCDCVTKKEETWAAASLAIHSFCEYTASNRQSMYWSVALLISRVSSSGRSVAETPFIRKDLMLHTDSGQLPTCLVHSYRSFSPEVAAPASSSQPAAAAPGT